MRFLICFSIALLILTSGCSSLNKHDGHSGSPQQEIVYKVRGVVKKVDAAASKITIDHEAIEGYMGAMEMEFDAEDGAMSADAKPGDKVEFELRRVGSTLTVISLKKAG